LLISTFKFSFLGGCKVQACPPDGKQGSQFTARRI